jgi:ribosomal protein L11 methyltransferase
VVGTDIDPQAITASRANALRNDVDPSFVPVEELSAGDTFDVVVANILANPIMSLAPAFARRLRRRRTHRPVRHSRCAGRRRRRRVCTLV